MANIIEIKARSSQQDAIRNILKQQNARFVGTDHQVDYYFNVPNGRLKMRVGNIENNLIHYFRNNQEGPKLSEVTLFKSDPDSSLKEILTNALGILAVVDKQREICFIDNVKFHIDTVEQLGTFVEIEAIDRTEKVAIEELKAQCDHYLKLFKIAKSDLVSCSYSDLIIQENQVI